MDILATLKKLHKQFPQLSLDDLLAILDCYVEKTTLHFPSEPKMPYDNKIWYSNSDMTANNLNLSEIYGSITTHAKGSRFTTGGND